MSEHQERIGQIVGDYRLLRWLGGGRFGNVYLAGHLRAGSQVAIKVLEVHLTSRHDLHSFIDEARTIRLRYAHIVPLLDFGLSREDTPFLVMEYAPRGTLRDCHPRGTRVPLLTVVEYATQIASALQYAHEQQLVHRDVKPENMLVRDDGTLLLSDFGIATATHSTHSLNVNQGIGGTIPYMAPEQLDGKPRAQSDQYALAVVIYEWLAGHCPFQGAAVEVAMQHAMKPPPSLLDQVVGLPAEVEEVVFKALAKNPKERFASMQAFATALQQASNLPTVYQPAPASPSQPPTVSIEEVSARIAPPPVGQKPVEKPAQLKAEEGTKTTGETIQPELLYPNTVMEPAPLDATTDAPAPITPLPSIPLPSPAPGRASHLSRRYLALLILLVLLIIGGGSYAYSTVNAYNNGYNIFVGQQGMMFGFDASHTRNNPYEHTLNVDNVSHLHVKWTATTGDIINSSPAVANGLVYVGSKDNKLYAFDALTGHPKWTALTGDAIYSSPTIANGLVYVGSTDHKLYAFDALIGRLKWATTTSDIITASPTIANGLVYIGSEDHKLYAFDALTGQRQWVTPAGDAIDSSPAIANGLVYVGSHDGKLYAFDALTGHQKWAVPTSNVISSISSSPAIANGLVYVGSYYDSTLYAFDALTGQPQWTATTGASIDSSPAIANDLVYVGSEDHKLYALGTLTGQAQWATPTGDVIDSSPTIANALVFVGSNDHKLYAFDALTGHQKWSASTGDVIFSSPTVANGFVYVGSQDNKLYAFSLS